jgi:hypothetical protein
MSKLKQQTHYYRASHYILNALPTLDIGDGYISSRCPVAAPDLGFGIMLYPRPEYDLHPDFAYITVNSDVTPNMCTDWLNE